MEPGTAQRRSGPRLEARDPATASVARSPAMASEARDPATASTSTRIAPEQLAEQLKADREFLLTGKMAQLEAAVAEYQVQVVGV